MNLEQEAVEADKAAPPTIGQVIARASSALADQHFSTGDRAVLRRVNPEAPAPAYAAACRLLARCGQSLEDAHLDRWVFVLHALTLATAIERPAHDRDVGFGQALAKADVSELRFGRLLTARGPALRDQIPLMARRLGAHGQKGDFRAVWDLLASDDAADEDYADRIRTRLARDYYVTRAREDANTNHANEKEET